MSDSRTVRADDPTMTVIASLLPVMWSTRAGVEVMKPLATQ